MLKRATGKQFIFPGARLKGFLGAEPDVKGGIKKSIYEYLKTCERTRTVTLNMVWNFGIQKKRENHISFLMRLKRNIFYKIVRFNMSFLSLTYKNSTLLR